MSARAFRNQLFTAVERKCACAVAGLQAYDGFARACLRFVSYLSCCAAHPIASSVHQTHLIRMFLVLLLLLLLLVLVPCCSGAHEH
jgi:uncharacterized membrane protein